MGRRRPVGVGLEEGHRAYQSTEAHLLKRKVEVVQPRKEVSRETFQYLQGSYRKAGERDSSGRVVTGQEVTVLN